MGVATKRASNGVGSTNQTKQFAHWFELFWAYLYLEIMFSRANPYTLPLNVGLQ